MAREHVVYIHGVVAERSRTRSHTEQYRQMRDGISAELVRNGGAELPSIDDSVTVEWGWNTPDAGRTATLTVAQNNIQGRLEMATPRDRTGFRDLLLSRAVRPVRDLLTLGWADIAYYIGREGSRRVRDVVWNEILRSVGTDHDVDLTIVSHSAGTLIAHDLLYWLYSGERDGIADLDRAGLDQGRVERARERWRIRRFVTFGSPISALMVRSAGVADIMASSETAKLDASDLGLGRPSHSGKPPVWLNVWDRHDVLSYPVAPFYEGADVVDLYPDHSDSLLASHEAYWRSTVVHRILAENWT